MAMVLFVCCLLVVATTVLHYEVLQALHALLPAVHLPRRAKMIVVVLGTFVAHALEAGLYALAFYLLLQSGQFGSLQGAPLSRTVAFYFSAENFTSMGFGDITPQGPIRLLAGVEALNGLLLIGWSASFMYLCMERTWTPPPGRSS